MMTPDASRRRGHPRRGCSLADGGKGTQRLRLMLRSWQWAFPIASVLSFVGLYAVAAALYPGGTRIDPTRVGFSLAENYWCDLLDVVTYGRHQNCARPVAIAAMAVLCSGLAVLWWTWSRSSVNAVPRSSEARGALNGGNGENQKLSHVADRSERDRNPGGSPARFQR
jgi:hypothetical protein